METTKLRRFAQYARRGLIEQVSAKLKLVLAADSAARRESPAAVDKLEQAIRQQGQEQLIERIAYIWFNRFCALRFMDVNRYNRVSIVSPADPGQFQPEILAEAKMGLIDADMASDKLRQQILDLLEAKTPSRDPQGEAYRLLVVAACNYWHEAMPFLFQRIDDYTELLMPDDLLSGNSILAYTREAMTPDVCQDVEVIGWLYQFYIAEKKDQVFEGLKKNIKITPQNIPAATQLFTPHWIVRYLVENSLGRLWLLNRPNSKLAEKMDYYIPPVDSGQCVVESEDQSTHAPLPTTHLRISSPEEIRICDPACGSGHMLTYAFDLLYAIYEEEGYESAEIPEKILTHNLYGIEIDERAGKLAAFALTMKARAKHRRFFNTRAKHRRFFNKGVKPNICILQNISDVTLEPEWPTILEAMQKSGVDRNSLIENITLFEEANNFGSLLRPTLTAEQVQKAIAALTAYDESVKTPMIGHWELINQCKTALLQADYLSQKYHVVIANPPYMGGKSMNGRLAVWLKDNYAEVKSDLFSAFIVRNTELALPQGQLGFMSPFVWMFISSYEKLRDFLINQLTITSLVQLEYSGFEGAVVPICAFTLENANLPKYRAGFIRLSDFKGVDNQSPRTLEAIKNQKCGWFFRASPENFKKIPGKPITYWIGESISNAFRDYPKLDSVAPTRKGMVTARNEIYVRDWYEVSLDKSGLDLFTDRETAKASNKKWFSYLKGGGFRKWYGNKFDVVNWENDGELLQTTRHPTEDRIWATNFNLEYIFKPNVNWGAITSSDFSARISFRGELFDAGGSACFPLKVDQQTILGFLNAKISRSMLRALNPTLNFQAGNIANLPFLMSADTLPTRDNVKNLILGHKSDWDSYETSWDFNRLPLLDTGYQPSTLKATYQKLRAHWQEMTLEMQRLEQQNNRIFIEAYGLQDELTPDVPLNEITLTCNPHYRYGGDKSEDELEALLLADTMRELISYAVGCMFGRYALDKPGLILANQGETLADFFRKVCSGECVVDSKEGNDGDCSQLSGTNSLAEGDGFSGAGLSGDETVSEGGALRSNEPDQTVGGFHTVQYRGRSGQKIDGGVSQFLIDCQRFTSGNGDPNSDCPALKLCNARYSATTSFEVGGSKQIAVRPDERLEITPHCPLSTIHYLPDDDNVIPMLDGDWFSDDIAERFRQFLRVAFGEAHYAENLQFVEQGLNLKGKRNYTIRDYFLSEFYADHVKRYKKRPIYWLFSSPKGSFNALIYLHRYRPDTVSIVLNDYLREFNTKLTAHKNHLEAASISASASQAEKTKALKEIEKIKKIIAELAEYEREVLYPLATQQLKIDLDDGVKVNYPKFGAALKKIIGLDSKEE